MKFPLSVLLCVVFGLNLLAHAVPVSPGRPKGKQRATYRHPPPPAPSKDSPLGILHSKYDNLCVRQASLVKLARQTTYAKRQEIFQQTDRLQVEILKLEKELLALAEELGEAVQLRGPPPRYKFWPYPDEASAAAAAAAESSAHAQSQSNGPPPIPTSRAPSPSSDHDDAPFRSPHSNSPAPAPPDPHADPPETPAHAQSSLSSALISPASQVPPVGIVPPRLQKARAGMGWAPEKASTQTEASSSTLPGNREVVGHTPRLQHKIKRKMFVSPAQAVESSSWPPQQEESAPGQTGS